MPCGTERSEPVQMLKITPVLPGAMTENELITLNSTTIAPRPTASLLVIFARCSGDSRIDVMFFVCFLVRSTGPELRHVDDGHVVVCIAGIAGKLRQEIAFEAPLQRAQQQI